MLREIGLLAALWIGCSRTADAPSYPEPVPLGTDHVVDVHQTYAPAHPAPRGRAQYEVRQQLSDLRYVEELLVAGRIDEASPLADRLPPDHRSATASRSNAGATDTPHPMTGATTVVQACRVAAQITASCGACHQRVGAHVTFAFEPAPPAGDPSRCSPRHRWAVERLTDGLASGADRPWRAGLDAFMTTPMSGPGSPQRERVQGIARDALAHFATDTPDARAAIYSNLLATCSSCHAATRERTRHGPEVL